MNESTEIELIRAEALRKLGRNIVNFAKIEAGLKMLLSVIQLDGTEEKLTQNQQKLYKQTLGSLVQKFNEDVFVGADQPEFPKDFSGLCMVFFKLHYDNPNLLLEKKRILLDLVKERNKLIHHDLAPLDTTSVEDYRKLIEILDEQNPRLLAHLEDFKWLVESVQENWTILQELAKSSEFLEMLSHEQSL